MQTISRIEIKPDEDMTGLQSIDRRLKALILTAEGTLPGSRAFGLAPEFLDTQTREAANLLALELSEKAEIYVPEVEIADVSMQDDGNGGTAAQIHIERRDEV